MSRRFVGIGRKGKEAAVLTEYRTSVGEVITRAFTKLEVERAIQSEVATLTVIVDSEVRSGFRFADSLPGTLREPIRELRFFRQMLDRLEGKYTPPATPD